MLGLIAEVVPLAKTFAYTNTGTNGQWAPVKQAEVQSVTEAAGRLGLTMIPIIYAPGGGEAEYTKAFAAITASKAEMVVIGTDTSVSATAQQQVLAKLSSNARLPAIAPYGGFAAAGGLLAYGGDLPALARQCADYVAMILKGAKPGDLPVLQPTVFDLIVNQRTAKAIGASIPESLLIQATQVIS